MLLVAAIRCAHATTISRPASTVAGRVSPRRIRGEIETIYHFDFRSPARTIETRGTTSDFKFLDTRITSVSTGDSVTSHRRDIWRLDKGVRWSLDFGNRTYSEVDFRTEREVANAFDAMNIAHPGSVPTRVGSRDTIAGHVAERYRLGLRDPDSDSLVGTWDLWIAHSPSSAVTRRFSERFGRARGRESRVSSRADSHADAGWPSDGIWLRRIFTPVEERARPRYADDDTSLVARMERASASNRPPVDNRLADSLSAAWRIQPLRGVWSADEIQSIRETTLTTEPFQIPKGFTRRELSNQDFWPWAKASKRAPPGTKRLPGSPPRLNPFALLEVVRPTGMHPAPAFSSRSTMMVLPGTLLDPLELDPVGGFYRLQEGRAEDSTAGWVWFEDVRDMPDKGPWGPLLEDHDVSTYARQVNRAYSGMVLSSVGGDSIRVVARVGKAWDSLPVKNREAIARQLAWLAASRRRQPSVVFQDSLRNRRVATYEMGKFVEE